MTTIVQIGLQSRRLRYFLGVALLVLMTTTLCIMALVFGKTMYSLDIVFRVLSGETIEGANFAIGTLRLPRMLAGLLTGIAFGIAGSTFQTMLRNPLASPDLIGITAGTSVAAVFCLLVLHISGPQVAFISIGSGILVALLIYKLSNGAAYSGGRLILIGLGVQAMLNAVLSYLLLQASQYDIPAAMRWLSGSLNGIRLSEIPVLALAVFLFALVILSQGKTLMMLELGEQTAIALGVRADRSRQLLIICSVVLIAFASATAGPIAFVSFLAGPMANRLVGTGQANQLPAGLMGAVIVIAADLIGQFGFGTKFPVGVITGILGAPFLLVLLIRINRSGGSA